MKRKKRKNTQDPKAKRNKRNIVLITRAKRKGSEVETNKNTGKNIGIQGRNKDSHPTIGGQEIKSDSETEREIILKKVNIALEIKNNHIMAEGEMIIVTKEEGVITEEIEERISVQKSIFYFNVEISVSIVLPKAMKATIFLMTLKKWRSLLSLRLPRNWFPLRLTESCI